MAALALKADGEDLNNWSEIPGPCHLVDDYDSRSRRVQFETGFFKNSF